MTLDEVKNLHSMTEVIGMFGIRPNRSGFAHCPFHNDKGASMKIYQKDAHCFGCGWHGDMIDFIARINNLTFKEAFQYLGGTYEKNEDIKAKIKEAEERRKRKQQAEADLKEEKKRNNDFITLLRKGIDCYPVFSDEWCICQNELQLQLYKHEQLSQKEVM